MRAKKKLLGDLIHLVSIIKMVTFHSFHWEAPSINAVQSPSPFLFSGCLSRLFIRGTKTDGRWQYPRYTKRQVLLHVKNLSQKIEINSLFAWWTLLSGTALLNFYTVLSYRHHISSVRFLRWINGPIKKITPLSE